MLSFKLCRSLNYAINLKLKRGKKTLIFMLIMKKCKTDEIFVHIYPAEEKQLRKEKDWREPNDQQWWLILSADRDRIATNSFYSFSLFFPFDVVYNIIPLWVHRSMIMVYFSCVLLWIFKKARLQDHRNNLLVSLVMSTDIQIFTIFALQ